MGQCLENLECRGHTSHGSSDEDALQANASASQGHQVPIQSTKALVVARRISVTNAALTITSLTAWAAERMSCNGRLECPGVEQGIAGLVDEFVGVTGSPSIGMNLEQFTGAIESNNNFIARSIFERMSCNTPMISCKDFVASMSLLRFGTDEDRLAFTFKLYDVDNSGSIEQADLVEMLRASLKETKVEMDDEQLARMASGMINTLDEDQDGSLSLQDFASIQKRYPDLALLQLSPSPTSRSDSHKEGQFSSTPKKGPSNLKFTNGTVSNASTPSAAATNSPWRASPLSPVQAEDATSTHDVEGPTCFKFAANTLSWARNNPQNIGCAILYTVLIACCFYLTGEATCSFLGLSCSLENEKLHKMMTVTLFIAKGSAGVTKLAFSTIILPICRNTVTLLRETWLRRLLPFDDAINWHKAIAWVGFVFAFAHSLSHINNYIRLSSAKTADQFHDLFGQEAQQPSLASLWTTHVSITGVLMCLIMLIAYLFASEWPRQATWMKDTWAGRVLNNFNNFAATHCLFVALYLLFIFHAFPRPYGYGDMLFWVAIPLTIYGVEKFIKCWWRRGLDFQILDAQLMPGNTVALQLSKPAGFKYLSGQYVFLSIPRLGWMEWHPFTLTTAPDDDYLGLQIRAAGDWTQALHDHVKEIVLAQQEAQAQDYDDLEKGTYQSLDSDGVASADSKSDQSSEVCFPVIRIDGPYGAPTQKWQKYQTAVMVGAGIGVTPCASVLRDVLHNIQREQESISNGNAEAPSLKKSQSHRARGPDCSTRKVLFYWCTRNKDEAQWFREELESIAKIDTQGILDINIHITNIAGDGAPMSNFLKIGQMSSHQVHGKDVMTGLQTNFITKFGRPDWAEVLARATQETSGPGNNKVGVFYCGPPALAAVLQKTCGLLNKSKELPAALDFYQERF